MSFEARYRGRMSGAGLALSAGTRSPAVLVRLRSFVKPPVAFIVLEAHAPRFANRHAPSQDERPLNRSRAYP